MFHPGSGPSLFSNIFNHRLVCSLLYISKQKNIPLITKGRDFIPCIAWVDATVMCVYMYFLRACTINIKDYLDY